MHQSPCDMPAANRLRATHYGPQETDFGYDDRLRLVLVLHQHQPVGNLDQVSEDVYGSCYLPLVETLSDYPSLPVNLHVSGSLVDWLAARHPEYIQRLRDLATAGRIEMLGGAITTRSCRCYRTRIGAGKSTRSAAGWANFSDSGRAACGCPSAVWEPSLAADMAACAISSTRFWTISISTRPA